MSRDRKRKLHPAYFMFLGFFLITVLLSSCGREEMPVSTGQLEETGGRTWPLDEHARVLSWLL
ncbi:MAG: hypothetical protein K2M22_04110 [Lachnospiraceae bacterium]|nr:hypothetical protein [Lachnospiraceae bacterium]